MSKRRWVLWAAVSSVPQLEGYSLDEQLKEGRTHAARWEGEIVAELVVDGDSRDIIEFADARQRIPEYQQLFDLMRQRQIDVLVYRNRGRLGRDPALSMAIISYCRRNNIIPYDLEDPPHDLTAINWNVGKEMLGAIRSVNFQDELQQLRAHHDKGIKRRVADGNFPGRPPWGWHSRYEMVEGKRRPQLVAEVDPVALKALHLIIHEYLYEGTGQQRIADILNEHGFPTPTGTTWSKQVVQNIIDRIERYAGIVEINKRSKSGREYVRAKSKWPALISMEEAQAVQKEKERRRHARRSVGTAYRFSQCVYCEMCSPPRRMVAFMSTVPNKRDKTIKYKYEVYRCQHSTYGHQLHSGGFVSGRLVHEAVEAAIQFLADKEYREKIVEDAPDPSATIQQEIDDLNEQIAKRRADLMRIDDRYADGTMDLDRYTRQVERITEAINAHSRRIEALQQDLQTAQHDSRRPARILELADEGLRWLTEPNVQRANAWFRQRLRIYVADNVVTRVEFL